MVKMDGGDWVLKKNKGRKNEDFEADVNRTRNHLIWSQTRYYCATDPRCHLSVTYIINQRKQHLQKHRWF
jgi:hypothetical protein